MYELLYTSVSPKGLSDQELLDLLEKARSKNQNNGVTGMLVYHDHEIMQILEGEERIVKDLFQAISQDDRHTSVEAFYQGVIERRAFGEWSMAFKLLDEGSANILVEGYEVLGQQASPISMIKDSPNRGKEAFLSLREMLLKI